MDDDADDGTDPGTDADDGSEPEGVRDPRDAFSSRLHEEPSGAHLHHYRQPTVEAQLRYLWRPLLECNHAQAIMLAERKLLDEDDAVAIRRALVELEGEGEGEGEGDPPALDEVVAFEGPYFYIEDALAAAVGRDAAGRLHTGRSRNDLYAAATRMAVRERLLGTVDATLRARSSLLDRAASETETVMPAFTHSRPAQPITLAHYLLAVDHALDRHVERLRAAYEDANRSPLGAAAIGGTGFPIDRERLAGLLGFDGLAYNTYDAIGGVDYLPAAAAAVAGTLTTISRTSQDLLVWSMVEVGFLEQTEALSTVSSIMPQKKNPGVIEKARAAAAEAIGAATASSTALQATPFGDVGETWDAAVPTLRSSTAAADVLPLFAAIIEDIQVDEERMHADAVENFSTMTEVADTLVRELDLPFRAAHEIVGRTVHDAVADGRTAGEITVADLRAAARDVLEGRSIEGIDDAALAAALDPRTNVDRRDVVGGTAPSATAEDLEGQRRTLDAQRTWASGVGRKLEEGQDRLRRVP